MRGYRTAIGAGLLAMGAMFSLGQNALAQGNGKNDKMRRDANVQPSQGKRHEPPGHAKKKVVTADQAIVATREVLVSHGYEVVRIELVQGTRVVYYRRGNMGRGKGKGPIEKIVIRPEPDRVVFVSQPPKGLMIDINVRLGL